MKWGLVIEAARVYEQRMSRSLYGQGVTYEEWGHKLFGPGWRTAKTECPGCFFSESSLTNKGHITMEVEEVLAWHPKLKAWAAQMLLASGGVDDLG